ncbi:MAG: 2Fe-2S iron-sulfur cluster-binding protein, partial [Thermoplasmatota archaeon]
MVSLTIDGQPVEGGEGDTILDAAEEADIYIPTLCNHPDLPAFGGCRMCLVKVEGMGSYVPACSTPVRDGMVIQSDIEELNRLRRNILELMLSEHPSGCIVCADREMCFEYHRAPSKAGRTTGCRFCPQKDACDLYDIAEYLGIEDIRLPIEYREREVRRDDPFIERDYNLCILCGRCVRVCDEIRGIHAVDFVNRGHETTIGTAFQAPLLDSGCIFCGACIDVCPTGALSERRMKWGGTPERAVTTTCLLCPLGCSIEVAVTRDRIVNIHAAEEAGTSQLCVMGRFTLPALMQHHKRLGRPMTRENGVLRAASWDDALDAAAGLLREYEPHEVGFVASPAMTTEGAYVLQKLARAMGCGNIGVASNMASSGAAGLQARRVQGSVADVASADVVLLVGLDLRVVTPALAVSIYEAKKNGAGVLVVDGGEGYAPRWADCHVAADSYLDFFTDVQAELAGEKNGDADAAAVATWLRDGSPAIVYGPGMMEDGGGDEAVARLADVASLCDGVVLPGWDGGNVQGLLMAGCLPGKDGRDPVGDMSGLKALYLTQPLPGIPAGVETVILQDVYTSDLLDRADVVALPGGPGYLPGGCGSIQRRSP